MDKKIFRGGKVVLPDRVLEASLVVEGEKIAGLLHPGTELGAEYEVIDVAGKVLMPGVIDSHVHMWDPSPQNYREDWKCGSQCAASGGITTIIDMPVSYTHLPSDQQVPGGLRRRSQGGQPGYQD